MSELDRVHSESLRSLRYLVRLRGAARIIAAIKVVEAVEPKPAPDGQAYDIAKAFVESLISSTTEEVRDNIAKSWREHFGNFSIDKYLAEIADQPWRPTRQRPRRSRAAPSPGLGPGQQRTPQ